MYTQELEKRTRSTIAGLTILRYILHELASESNVDDASEEPNIFEQLTLFIDTRLDNTPFPPQLNILSHAHLAFITNILEKKIRMPHELSHVIQQQQGVVDKNNIKHTVEKLYGTIRSSPPEFLQALKIA